VGQRLGLWHPDIIGEACSISIYKDVAEVKPALPSPENIPFSRDIYYIYFILKFQF